MESFQGRAPPTGWNDLPANLSPNLKFGGGSSRTKRINRNNLYQQYYSNSSLYSSYSSSSSQEYGLNQQNPQNPQNQLGSQNAYANPNAPPMMGNNTPPPMMGSQNSLNQQPQPQMMGMQQQQTSAQTPSVNYFNPASSIPAPTFNNQTQFNNVNAYQPNNYTNQTSTPNYASNNSLNATSAPSINNISDDKKKYIMSVYNKHLDTYNASCSLFQRRIYEDARQRINTMFEQLNNNMIDEQTVAMLEAIANALETKNSNTAQTNVSYLMRSSTEKKWVFGVKELVDFICSK